ncbi:hypothetical protein JCM10296v2_002058 [Rhodotorula toruloides]
MASATTSSTTGAGAYSALLRRSKLATLNPRIDQVYTAPSSSRAHGNNYGLKRPLPTKSTRAAPFVRVLELDSDDGRTGYRKATRETKFTRQWAEVGVGIQATVLGDRAGSGGTVGNRRLWFRPEVQTRFMPAGFVGAIQQPGREDVPGREFAVEPVDPALLEGAEGVEGEANSDVSSAAEPAVDAASASPTRAAPTEPQPVPNFFLMQPRAFDQFLLDLGRRRSEFRAFVAEEENKRSVSLGQPATADRETYDLYAHAQREPVELVRLVERFLRLPQEVDPRFPDAEPSKRDPALAEPMPLVHPTLALQYSTPTPLESSLAPPVEGRILGPVNDAASRYGHIGAMYDRKNKVYAQVLSQISMIPANAAGNTQPTTWFPDVAGERSNVPGRASFRIQPTINPTTYAARASLERAGFYASVDFRPPTEEHGSALLDHSRIETHPVALPAEQLASIRPLPGTQAYSGNNPPEVRSRAGGSGFAFGARQPLLGSSLTDLWRDGEGARQGGGGALGSLGELFGGAGSRRRRQGGGADPIAQLRARRQAQGQQGQGQRGGSRKGQANERSRELIGKLQSMMNNGKGGEQSQ